uniref:Mitochondrial assembly of ribosomal large subunit 1 n=1 Tax=Rattus norvegicus TaxID=10116 RepID=A0ABK0KYE7_RAT
MGPGWSPARRVWPLLWRRVFSQRASPKVSSVPWLPRLAERWLLAGPATCLTPTPSPRGLHHGPQPEERTEGDARLQPGAADHIGAKFDIDMLVSLLKQENARDICVIKVPPEMRYTDYFVIGSGTSTRHLHAMVHYIVKTYKHLKCRSDPYVKIEGKDTDDWLCVDFVKQRCLWALKLCCEHSCPGGKPCLVGPLTLKPLLTRCTEKRNLTDPTCIPWIKVSNHHSSYKAVW